MDEVRVEVTGQGAVDADALAVPLPEDEGGALSNVDERIRGRLRRLAGEGGVKGELGKTVVVHTDGQLDARRLIVAGVGQREAVDSDAVRTAASAVARRLAGVGGTVSRALGESLTPR